MSDNTLISAKGLMARLAAGDELVLLDCSFDLADPQGGERAYRAGHLPGAQHADLERHLSGPANPAGPRSAAYTGRHPLPDRMDFGRQVGAWGIRPQTQVVTLDNHGSIYAARAWWMLRWLGHGAVAVLDGGLGAWKADGGALETQLAMPTPQPPYPATAHAAMAVMDVVTLASRLGRVKLVDARSPDRWRGENETLDPVGGHIPGSISRFFKDNLQADGRFRPAAELNATFTQMGLARAEEGLVHQCGSGVTACHNLLAMEHAGLSGGTLYPGSWSEWCADPARPIAKA